MKVSTERRRILVIDDEPGLLISVKDFLEDHGHTVETAENGREGLKMVNASSFDLVFTDLRMPDVDGGTVIRTLAESHPLLPVVAISGTGEVRQAIEAVQNGAWDYLFKPIPELNILLHTIETCLERAENRRRKQAYEKELEQQVAARTAELERVNLSLQIQLENRRSAEKKMREAMVLVERTARIASLGVMAGGINHEIAQPLNGILLNSDTLRYTLESGRPDSLQQAVPIIEDIKTGARRIHEIIKHMRSLWVAPISPTLGPTEISPRLRNVLSLHEQQLRNHGIETKVHQPDTPLVIHAQAMQLEQILINLLTNAMYAHDKVDKADKWIDLRVSSDDGTVRIEVIDNATGLPGVELDSLFDPFYSTRKEQQGSGLGLAIVRHFVESFGGKVTAANNEHGGATFTLSFPRISAASSPEAEA